MMKAEHEEEIPGRTILHQQTLEALQKSDMVSRKLLKRYSGSCIADCAENLQFSHIMSRWTSGDRENKHIIHICTYMHMFIYLFIHYLYKHIEGMCRLSHQNHGNVKQ